ncbi:hypothetical protein VL15_15615 [Burkholderia cepacia]|uniref:Uncharacterized protein n=1 Tax=Burkholderia cepacia TaxID=292 RepID=A0A0J5WQA1_BURCE|nr:hypothetical protein VL15_15615 [Burkholderia cepacia]
MCQSAFGGVGVASVVSSMGAEGRDWLLDGHHAARARAEAIRPGGQAAGVDRPVIEAFTTGASMKSSGMRVR